MPSTRIGSTSNPRELHLSGMVWTDLIIKDGVDEEQLKESQLTYPLKRFGQPEDVANLAIYLLSDASSWMTGSSLDISGGGEGLLTLN